jgi:carbon-monoxide dehydrogenase small subunit
MDENKVPEEEVSTAEEESKDVPGGEKESKKGGFFVTRRDFLIGSGAGVAVGAVAAAAGMSAVRPEAPAPAEEAETMPEEAPAEVAMVADELPATMRRVTLNINGKDYDITTDVRWSLWEVLAYKLDLGGSKRGCDRAECGACAVTVDGLAVNGCTVLAARLAGKKILTVEGLASGPAYEQLHPIQRAFIEKGGFQCGICTGGFIMSSHALLEENPNPTEDDIREALAGNICRCSEYPKVYDSVFQAAEWMG